MKFNEVMEKIDVEKPYLTSLTFDLSSITANATQTFVVGSESVFASKISIDFIDKLGNNIPFSDKVYDDFVVMVNSSNSYQFSDDVVSLRTLINDSLLNRGILFKHDSKYTFKITGNNIATSTFADYPIKIRINISGYKIID